MVRCIAHPLSFLPLLSFFFFLPSGHLGALLCRLCLLDGQRLTWTSLKKINRGLVIYDVFSLEIVY